jgi:hypothetical protein
MSDIDESAATPTPTQTNAIRFTRTGSVSGGLPTGVDPIVDDSPPGDTIPLDSPPPGFMAFDGEDPSPEDAHTVSLDLPETSIDDILTLPMKRTSLSARAPLGRESLAESDFNDIDESRFSTVALNITDKRDSVSSSFSVKSYDLFTAQTSKGHGRTSSNTSFLLARAQDPQFKHTVDGQQKLQEEFVRMHGSDQDSESETRAAGVDWGTYEFHSLRQLSPI